MRILGISGSLRAASHNTALLQAAAELAPEGVEIELYEGLDRLPHYNEDLDADVPPAEATRLRDAIRAADAVLFATPEYNGTVPSVVKNAVDWASRPRGEAVLLNKTAAVIGASTGQYGAIWAQGHLARALGLAGARVLEDIELAVGKANERFSPDGELLDDEIRDQLADVLNELAATREQLAAVA
jgi:chromate reductase